MIFGLEQEGGSLIAPMALAHPLHPIDNMSRNKRRLPGLFNFRYNFRLKSLSRAQNGGHFENFEISNTASIWHQIWKERPKLYKQKYFHNDDVIDDVTGWPQIRPSIFLYKWKINIFHDN